jgi:hypothetical protein
MLDRLIPKFLPALGLAAFFGLPSVLFAQATNPSNTNISTGSGAGTSPGVGELGTSSTRLGRQPLQGPSRIVPGPGQPRLPQIPSVFPVDTDRIEPLDRQLLPMAGAVQQPEERALTFERTARSKIIAVPPKFEEAYGALWQAGEAAKEVQFETMKDLRLRSVVQTLIVLAEELVRDGLAQDLPTSEATADTYKYRPLNDRLARLNKASDAWKLATHYSTLISSPNFRSEMLYWIADSESGQNGSQAIIVQTAQPSESLTGRRDLRGYSEELNAVADRFLVEAADATKWINRHIWRDKGLVSIVSWAAVSEQYVRALQIARTIPQPEYRADAMIRLAEAQARHKAPSEATATYGEAARAVASIPLEDPRSILAGVLVDSLMAVGRFDDARASITLYPDELRRMEALGAIAESQGERGLSESARAWIDREAPAQARSMLYRRVNDGLLIAIDKMRSQTRYLSPGSPGTSGDMLPGSTLERP